MAPQAKPQQTEPKTVDVKDLAAEAAQQWEAAQQLADNSDPTSEGQEVEVSKRFSKEQYGAIDSFDAAMQLAVATYGNVVAAHEEALLGDGFRVATEDDKRRLIGVPLLFLDWAFFESEYDADKDWVIVHAVQRGDSGNAIKWIINDGGTGIARDLKDYSDKTGRYGGLAVAKGLRVSEYQTDPDSGKPLTKQQVREYMVAHKKIGKGATFYLDTTA